jgi:glutathione S-transferase
MQLYLSPLSPYGRKVNVVLKEISHVKNIEVQINLASGTPLDPGSSPVQYNPLGKIPVLIRDDGFALYDSRVICRYLDSLATLNLYKKDNQHWEMLTLEATAEGIIDAALLMAYEWRMRPQEIRFPDWVEGQWLKIDRALNTLENNWMGQLEDKINIGQIGVGCALGYLDFRNADRDWREKHKTLSNWFNGFSERDSMSATTPSA